jgi:hypothetical protein
LELKTVKRELIRKYKQVGLLGTLRQGLRRLLQNQKRSATDAFDLKYGTDTAKMVSVGALDITAERLAVTNRYEAVSEGSFNESLKALKIDYKNFSFVDIGSGKGKALLLASRFPFRSIIGIELSSKLHAIAVVNIRVFQDPLQECTVVSSVLADALTYEIPIGDSVIFLYNPFRQEVMEAFVKKMEDFISQGRGSVYILYHTPHCRDIWDKSSLFKLQNSSPGWISYLGRADQKVA